MSLATRPSRLIGFSTFRRKWFTFLRRQSLKVEEHDQTPTLSSPNTGLHVLTRAPRAHYRLNWQERLTRNARMEGSTQIRITLFGIASHVTDYLNLSSISPGG